MYGLVCFLLIVFAWVESSADPGNDAKRIASVMAYRYRAESNDSEVKYIALQHIEDNKYFLPQEIPMLYSQYLSADKVNQSILVLKKQKANSYGVTEYMMVDEWKSILYLDSTSAESYNDIRGVNLKYSEKCESSILDNQDKSYHSSNWKSCTDPYKKMMFTLNCSHVTIQVGETENATFHEYKRDLKFYVPPKYVPDKEVCV
ncbi:uncharacterized protein LOC106059358 isoform X2 [Biomphalaria glabrata]|uniref:Uncharacterized protein LOC106059358 isoform X2 n=1 Tax=Biomphalaria glabrata TaxID=6526 RepID=A0A9W3BEW2_BIOGL|nr:uncharacterized protein LOC106059358 isoform X2 [Biomphalaria glabrata]